MALFPNDPNLVPIDPGNVVSNNWIILLEANTIVDSSGELRVAKTTQERKIVKRFRSFRRRPFLVVDGYDPRKAIFPLTHRPPATPSTASRPQG